MDYNTYCRKMGLNRSKTQSRTMYKYYLEAREASADIKKDEMYTPVFGMNAIYSVSTITPTQVCTEMKKLCPSVPCQEKNGKTMYVDNDKHIESSKINYLQDRAQMAYYKAAGKLPKTFGLENDAVPETPLELVKRIQDGKFVTRKETEDKKSYEPARFIVWRDPSVKEDKEGYAVAEKALGEVHKDTRDAIVIGTPAEGLAAVKALDAWTPTVGNA